MTDADTLGKRLRAQRTKLGFTLAQVADGAQLSLPYLSNLERGRGNPTMDALTKIAGALDISIKDLVGEADGDDQVDALLGTPPASLVRFTKSDEFVRVVARLADAQGVEPAEMRKRIVTSMSTAPRRSTGEPTEADWRRLLDTYSLILGPD